MSSPDRLQTIQHLAGADALFSPCRRYRYRLWRIWDPSKGVVLFIMLNPSTADEIENDPTIARCAKRAKRLGFGGCIVVNVFAWRSTDPGQLLKCDDPVGEANNYHILACAKKAALIICGWGEHASIPGWSGRSRHSEVIRLLRSYTLHCLVRNQSGYPGHPLYIGYAVKPFLYRLPRA